MFRRGPLPQHWHSIDTLNSGLVAPQAAPVSTTLGAGAAIYTPLIVRNRITVAKLWVACGASGTNLDIGLYDVGGTRLVSSGSQSHPASATEYVYDATDTVISPGVYYFAVLALTGTGSFYAHTTLTGPIGSAYGVWAQTSLSSLPASATFSALSAAYAQVGGILTNTVVS